jgi:hypothetical protein
MDRPSFVCITPVKNEAWVLDRFLAAAETWADTIIVLDQQSTDGSQDIVTSHPKATLVENPADQYDEGLYRRLLLEAARRLVPGPRILISLDADEALTADATDQREWSTLLGAAPGTVIQMNWVNVLPDEPRAWIPPIPITFGLVDDDSDYEGWRPRIHATRLPTRADAETLAFQNVKVLHLQYLDWERMRSKQRWYQAWERVNIPSRRPTQIYRRYHHMDAIRPSERRPLAPGWIDRYTERGIDLLAPLSRPVYQWDQGVIDMVRDHGARRFRKIDIWSADWQAKAEALGSELPDALATDSRTWWDRRVFSWLARTQSESQDMRIRWAQRALRLTGW